MAVDIIASLRQNILRVSLYEKKELKTAQETLSPEVVSDTDISDVDAFVEVLKKLISGLTSVPKSRLRINILVDPSDVILRFLASNKKEGSFDDFMVSEVKNKLEGQNIEDFYFSYEKLAPFVYQMAAMKVDKMEKLLRVSDAAGLSLYSLIPWALFLPRFVGISEPSIFIIQQDDKKILVLSELQGVFFTGVFSDGTTESDLNKLVHELAFYKREKPIKRVYTLGCSDVRLEGEYKISAIDLPGEQISVDQGFELNVLADHMLNNPDRYSSSQLNLLTLLPLPAVPEKKNALVYVGAGVGMLLLVIGGYFGYSHLASRSGEPSVSPPDENVLSETTVVQETTPVIETSESTPSIPAVPVEELKTEDLTVRIENAAGVNGLAGRTKDFLEKFGYKIDSIDTADKDQEPTTLRFKKSKTMYKDLMLSDMKESFPNVIVEDTLAEEAKYDVLVLIGTTASL